MMMRHVRRVCRVYDVSARPRRFEQVYLWQRQLLEERVTLRRRREEEKEEEEEEAGQAGRDALLVAQHRSVYTLGRGATEDNLLFPCQVEELLGRDGALHPALRGSASVKEAGGEGGEEDNEFRVLRIDRGGEVTWHGPGQLLFYPSLDLKASPPHRQDLHWLLRQLEEVILRALNKAWGIAGERDAANTGVWVGEDKIAAIGVHASRWVTLHGFSFNVCPDQRFFGKIVPCGIEGKGVCSLQDLCPSATVAEARAALMDSFADVFDLHLETEPENASRFLTDAS